MYAKDLFYRQRFNELMSDVDESTDLGVYNGVGTVECFGKIVKAYYLGEGWAAFETNQDKIGIARISGIEKCRVSRHSTGFSVCLVMRRKYRLIDDSKTIFPKTDPDGEHRERGQTPGPMQME